MAGSINLSLSQQFDKLNGNLLSGGRLYFYAAGTDAPQNAFKDNGLVLPHPNPIILASDGRVPQLYFADGSIHVRLTDSGGVVQFDEDFVLVIGPSSGSGGGGGGGVDPNAIFQVGDFMWQPVGGGRSGWVIANGSTIGNGSSGATHGNADALALFEFNYGTYSDALCPVSGGRTGNATDDFNAGKTLKLLDAREIIIGGLSTMGSPLGDRGSFGSVPIERGDRNTPASIIGEITHALSTGEMTAHAHDLPSLTDPGHAHTVATGASGTINAALGPGPTIALPGGSIGTGTSTTGVALSSTVTSTNGSSAAHNTTPRIMLGTFYQRL